MQDNQDLSIPKLRKIKEQLIKKQEALLNELKTKHQSLYNWLIDHNIDFNNLQKYTKNIAAALTLSNQLLISNINPQTIPTPPTPEPKQTETNNSVSLTTDEEKAKKVWDLYGEIIKQVAEKYHIDSQLIFATIMTESEGDPKAYRYEYHIGDASYGLGQILYTTALGMGFTGSAEELYRPEVNIDLIAKYHKNTLDNYGPLSPERMTTIYNTGKLFGYPFPGHIDRFQKWYYSFSKGLLKIT